jgi:hypothetical protein
MSYSLVLVSGMLFEIEIDVGGERATITYSIAADANTGDESEWTLLDQEGTNDGLLGIRPQWGRAFGQAR